MSDVREVKILAELSRAYNHAAFWFLFSACEFVVIVCLLLGVV